MSDPAEMFAIAVDGGGFIERRADWIRSAIEAGFTDDHCPVCARKVEKLGQGPHMLSHRRLIGDAPPASGTPRKLKKRAYNKKPSVDEACYGLLSALVGDKIPISMVGDVQAWVKSTEKLVGALK